jgi:hypothetical protein
MFFQISFQKDSFNTLSEFSFFLEEKLKQTRWDLNPRKNSRLKSASKKKVYFRLANLFSMVGKLIALPWFSP